MGPEVCLQDIWQYSSRADGRLLSHIAGGRCALHLVALHSCGWRRGYGDGNGVCQQPATVNSSSSCLLQPTTGVLWPGRTNVKRALQQPQSQRRHVGFPVLSAHQGGTHRQAAAPPMLFALCCAMLHAAPSFLRLPSRSSTYDPGMWCTLVMTDAMMCGAHVTPASQPGCGVLMCTALMRWRVRYSRVHGRCTAPAVQQGRHRTRSLMIESKSLSNC